MALFQLFAIGVFYTLFIGRSITMHRRGERVFVIGKGKRGASDKRKDGSVHHRSILSFRSSTEDQIRSRIAV